MALSEVNNYPLQQNWLGKLFDLSFESKDFLMKGTILHHHQNHGFRYQNYIWNLGNSKLILSTLSCFESYEQSLTSTNNSFEHLLSSLLDRPGLNMNRIGDLNVSKSMKQQITSVCSVAMEKWPLQPTSYWNTSLFLNNQNLDNCQLRCSDVTPQILFVLGRMFEDSLLVLCE